MGKTLVIAEPGCTHEGSRERLIELLDVAASCGANCFKPQFVSDPAQMCERRHITADHPKREYYLRAYSWLHFPVEWHAEFSKRCRQLGMQYAVTCFLPQDVWTVAPYVDLFKVASFENGDWGLLRTALATERRTILSLGMLSAETLAARAVGWLGRDCLLCTSAYPAPVQGLGLERIRQYNLGGLSDHTRCVRMGAIAVGAGATIVEAHYRLDDCDPENPDYPVAFTPAEFTDYIAGIREAEAALPVDDEAKAAAEAWAVPYRVGA